MNANRGYYGLIQYCPNPSRAEGANVGVVLYCPEPHFLDVRMSRGNDRARRFFTSESLDLLRLEATKRAFERRLRGAAQDFRSVQDLEAFMRTRGNDLRLIPPRPIKVEDPAEALASLFEELVGGRTYTATTRPTFQELDEALRGPRMKSRIQLNQVVTVPVVERHLMVPYVYRNAREHLVLPHLFPESAERASRSAERLALEGDLLSRRANKQLIVVAGFEEVPSEQITQHLEQLFGLYSTRLVRHSEIPKFVNEVDAEAHEF